jgi:hypothetical protein
LDDAAAAAAAAADPNFPRVNLLVRVLDSSITFTASLHAAAAAAVAAAVAAAAAADPKLPGVNLLVRVLDSSITFTASLDAGYVSSLSRCSRRLLSSSLVQDANTVDPLNPGFTVQGCSFTASISTSGNGTSTNGTTTNITGIYNTTNGTVRFTSPTGSSVGLNVTFSLTG